MPLLSKRSVLAAKIETTIGTPIALLAADGAFNAYDVVILPATEVNRREGQGSLSKLLGIPSGVKGTVSFEVDLADTAAWAPILLPACALKVATSTWGPVSTGADFKTITIARYLDGKILKLAGCMLNAEFKFVTGQPVRVAFTGQGVWIAPTDGAILAPTYPTGSVAAPAFKGATVTLGALTPKFLNFNMNLNNDIIMRECADSASGYISAWITDRNVSGTIDPETDLVADFDADGIQLAATEQAFSLAYASTVTLLIPKMQLTATPIGDRGGLAINEMAWDANRVAAAGDDEFSIEI